MQMNTELARRNMVGNQVRTWEVLDPRVLDALGAVRREDFVPARYRNLAFADLAVPLEKLVATLPKKEVRGRTTEKILANNLARAAFDADVNNESKRFKAERIATTENAPRAIDELYRAMRDTVIRAKLHR